MGLNKKKINKVSLNKRKTHLLDWISQKRLKGGLK